jgi:hypothetical protein
MNQKRILKQMLDFNRSAFETSFNMISSLQDQTQRAAEMYLQHANQWLPQEQKNAIDEWTKAFRQGRETFKNTVDDSFKKAEALLVDTSQENA